MVLWNFLSAEVQLSDDSRPIVLQIELSSTRDEKAAGSEREYQMIVNGQRRQDGEQNTRSMKIVNGQRRQDSEQNTRSMKTVST